MKMNIKVPIPDKEYKVMVRCATYNQSKYIWDALNGFAIQETDFPFMQKTAAFSGQLLLLLPVRAWVNSFVP